MANWIKLYAINFMIVPHKGQKMANRATKRGFCAIKTLQGVNFEQTQSCAQPF